MRLVEFIAKGGDLVSLDLDSITSYRRYGSTAPETRVYVGHTFVSLPAEAYEVLRQLNCAMYVVASK